MRSFGMGLKTGRRFAALAGFGLSSVVLGADVTDADQLLCYGWSAAVCDTESVCEVTEPWRLNMPDFVTIDLDDQLITSTAGEEEERETPISTVKRDDGAIILHGDQDGRAFSWLITESTGEGTLTVSAADQGVVLFTICTDQDDL